MISTKGGQVFKSVKSVFHLVIFMKKYNPKIIEKKWQKYWEKQSLFKTPEDATPDNKFYILPQLPYPSGSGLHVGHAEVYSACDIYARYQRMKGKKVLQVIGWDSFGLPAENYAIKTNVHPRKSTDDAINNFRSQIKSLGISVDWDREVGAHNPDYYKWTQWFFLLFYKRGLAYRKMQAVNWCDSCKTVLANDQVKEGHCERCDTLVSQKEMEQWYIKITDYAERLLKDLDKVDWPEETKKRQKDWIGKSEGAEVNFNVVSVVDVQDVENEQAKRYNKQSDITTTTVNIFTTRPDTLFGATYMVLAPEGQYVQKLKDKITNWKEVEKYIKKTSKKTELDRQIQKEKTGVELQGIKAINPVNNEEIPIFVADYVLASYGTGAIMAVPAHDERDFEFAKKYHIPIKPVVAFFYANTSGEDAFREDKPTTPPRRTINALLKHWDENKYLCLDWEKFGWHTGIIGVIDEGESIEKAALREAREETGFKNIEFVYTIGIENHNTFFARHKDENRYAIGQGVLLQLKDGEQEIPNEKETKNHNMVWMEADKVRDFFNLPNFTFVWEMFEKGNDCFTFDGVAINSDFLTGLETKQAKEKIIQWLEEHNVGKRKVQYKLRDWSVSRQRFWGAPIPMLYDEKGELHPVPESDLPVILPDDVDFKPTGEPPLNYSKDFQKGVEKKYGKGWKREPDTLDTFMCSSWYYYRYLDPYNYKEFASPEALKKWMPVDFYLGGPEHVNGHLLYSRFFTKVLYDAGYIDFDEPFKVHRHQGLILGKDNRKMSKRWNNAINPTDVVNEYGADTMRMYEMFIGPLEEDKPWNDVGVRGIRRFLERVWNLRDKVIKDEEIGNWKLEIDEPDKQTHKVIRKVSEDLENLSFNTAIAKLMELTNLFSKQKKLPITNYQLLIILLSPFAPHMAEELWNKLGNKKSIIYEPWPQYDKEKIIDDIITLVVQINGKVRANLEVDAEISEEEAKKKALADEKVQKWLEGRKPKKVIYISGKLVSIVV